MATMTETATNQEIIAEVTRSGKWWAVEVEVDGKRHATQGRTLAEAQLMATDLVAIWAEFLERPELAKTPVRLVPVGEVGEAVERTNREKAEAAIATRKAQEDQASLVRRLRRDGIKVADIAQLLGLTKGRVSQLARAQSTLR